MAKDIIIQNKTFTISKLKGKQLRKLSKISDEDSLKFIEVILDVDEAFVDEMDIDEINLVSEILTQVNPSMKEKR